jgi:hypothetical protein
MESGSGAHTTWQESAGGALPHVPQRGEATAADSQMEVDQGQFVWMRVCSSVFQPAPMLIRCSCVCCMLVCRLQQCDGVRRTTLRL